MSNQTSQTVEPNQGQARGVIPFAPDGFPFIVGSAIATIGAYCLAWTTAAIILGVSFLFILNFFRDFEQDTAQEGGMKVSFVQIYGLIVRRIVSYVNVGDKVVAGKIILARKKVV